ncbi:MAG: cation-efflux pump [Candidatus Bathyarchaeia archaeon]
MESVSKLKALKLSTIVISSVVIVEVFLGFTVGSLAILSDGLHALLDALTTLGLFIATRASLKPPDEEHMYGHEKFESLGGLAGGLMLVGIAIFIMFESVLKLLENKQYINLELELAGYIAVGYTFCTDIFRVGTLRKALQSESYTVKAGLYHAIADLGSTVIAFVGFALATQGFYYGDSLASMFLSALLTYLSIRLVWNSGMELSDAISRDVAQKVRSQILSTKGVCKCENLRVRRVGAKFYVEAVVHVPEDMSLEEAHTLASNVEANIKNVVGNAHTTIHVEPSKTEISPKRLVEKIAEEVEGVKETHNIETLHIGGKLYLTLHVRVDPKLSVEEAHEIAEKIESKIIEKISNVENVTVHLEPFITKARARPTLDEDEIRKVLQKTEDNFQHVFCTKRITTYTNRQKTYINIVCGFGAKISVSDAHKIASQIEKEIKKNFAGAVVTVHMEPS